jgi:hypothetical protein
MRYKGLSIWGLIARFSRINWNNGIVFVLEIIYTGFMGLVDLGRAEVYESRVDHSSGVSRAPCRSQPRGCSGTTFFAASLWGGRVG